MKPKYILLVTLMAYSGVVSSYIIDEVMASENFFKTCVKSLTNAMRNYYKCSDRYPEFIPESYQRHLWFPRDVSSLEHALEPCCIKSCSVTEMLAICREYTRRDK